MFFVNKKTIRSHVGSRGLAEALLAEVGVTTPQPQAQHWSTMKMDTLIAPLVPFLDAPVSVRTWASFAKSIVAKEMLFFIVLRSNREARVRDEAHALRVGGPQDQETICCICSRDKDNHGSPSVWIDVRGFWFLALPQTKWLPHPPTLIPRISSLDFYSKMLCQTCLWGVLKPECFEPDWIDDFIESASDGDSSNDGLSGDGSGNCPPYAAQVGHSVTA